MMITHLEPQSSTTMTTQFEASSSSSSSSSPSATIQSWTYHVFLSFRGEDTRNTFTGHLHSNLVQKGIKTFIDDDGLPRGEEISSALFKAIEESKISVIVFSENYASSKWCLEELAKIIQCKESKNQMVYPVFYKVDPSDVRKQCGSFGQALAHHDNSKVVGWKTALTKAGNLSGWHISQGGHESEFIHKIVAEISQQVLNFTYLNGDKYLVGIESRFKHMEELLCVGESDVRMIGIWGIGGIGKTTIAKAVYNLISRKFEGSCFLENVRERSVKYGGLQKLQKFLLSKTLGLKEVEVNSLDEGSTMIKERLSHKRVLLILDDVNDLEQLKNLVRKCNWFGPSSRIIITTRDQGLLRRHDVNQIYQVEKLSHHEALQLFNFNAFKGKGHMGDYVELIDKVICYAEGLPLVVEDMGSYLHGRSIDTWKDALEVYKRNPKLQHFLKLSYDSLEPLIKEIFLHIACFFKGENKNYVMDILAGCDLPKHGIEILIEKSLISITETNGIWMHGMLEEMGKEIVCQESLEPGERSRLWLYKDVSHVFMHNTGTNKVKGIMVKKGMPDQHIPLNSESFLKLNSLEILIISDDIFSGDCVDYLPNELILLDWVACPLQYFPSNFYPEKIIVLKMNFTLMSPRRALETGFQRKMSWICTSPQIMQNLKSLNLGNCDAVTLSDFSKFPNLEELKIRGSRKVDKFEIVEEMKSLKRLDLSGTAIKELPSSAIRYLINLEQLTLSGCKTLKHVPCNIFELQHLQLLDLSGCEKLVTFPTKSEMKSLKRLDLSGTAIKELPSSAIRYLINLEQLTLSGCKKLEHVPCNIFELQHLRLLDLSGCEKLVTFPTKSEFSTESTSLEDKDYAPLFVNLSSCYDLAEIVEFPREIYDVNASCCSVLKRISKLSNILEGKESKMTPWMNLFQCGKLYRTLARDVAKVKKNLPDNSRLTALLSLFFSCRQSEYQVLFPGSIRSYERLFGKVESSWRLPEIGLPQWFTCRMYISNKGLQVCNFEIDFPGNFKWEDKGLAFSALTIDNENLYTKAYMRVLKIYINDVRIIDASEKPEDSRSGSFYDLVWLYYVPFDTIIKRLGESGLPPPSMCLVKFEFEYKTLDGGEDINGWIGSCGVHVVMPEDEDPFVNGIVRPSTLIMGTNSYPGDDAEDPPTV